MAAGTKFLQMSGLKRLESSGHDSMRNGLVSLSPHVIIFCMLGSILTPRGFNDFYADQNTHKTAGSCIDVW